MARDAKSIESGKLGGSVVSSIIVGRKDPHFDFGSLRLVNEFQ